MDARQRVGAVLMVAGVALVLAGAAAGFMGSSASEAAVASVAPATAPRSAVTPEPTATITPAATLDTFGIVQAFFEGLQTEMQNGTQEVMADLLAPAVLARYGQDACFAYLSSRDPAPEQRFVITAVHDPAPWDYVTDGRTTAIPDATTVDAHVTGADASGAVSTQDRELHVQIIAGVVHWFTDCGTPLA